MSNAPIRVLPADYKPAVPPPIPPRPPLKSGMFFPNISFKQMAVVPKNATSVVLPDEPTMTQLASNFSVAVLLWAAKGFPIVTKEQYQARTAVCESCQFWDGSARSGLGTCKAPGCGCTKFKRWLKTEKCVLKKWPND